MQRTNTTWVRRTQKSGVHMYNEPCLKLGLPDGRVLISRKAAEILEITVNDGLMFGFNQKEKRAYVIKDDEPDAFIVRRKKDEYTYRFTSKDLARYFSDTFSLGFEGDHLFRVEKASIDGTHRITPWNQ